jgi:hypothetical protein
MTWDWPNKEYKDEPEKLERHRKERSEQGFSTFDWWSFDTYIAGVIGRAVLKFREDGMGYPGDMTEESWNAFCTEIAEPLIAYSDQKFDVTREDEFKLYEDAKEAMHKFSDRLGYFWD